jgi:chemotaxis protein histidine kinase CheA
VRELHGTFDVQSKPTHGTRLIVTLPVSEDVPETNVARVAS